MPAQSQPEAETPGPSSGATDLSPFLSFSSTEWADLRAATPLTLSESDLAEMRGVNEQLSIDEVTNVYLPLSRLLNLYVGSTHDLSQATDVFLGTEPKRVPYLIGLGGSVAVGKSTTARILRELLRRWPNHPRVELITTDGFLYPNSVLAERGLMQRKGFPESYDVRSLLRCIADLKSGAPTVTVPQYSHLVYDVTATPATISAPDIVIVEGLNVLQTGSTSRTDGPAVFVSDYFDFRIYVDAAMETIRRWYIERFLALREGAFADPRSYFNRYATLSDAQATATAGEIWDSINGPNLIENILPTRERADLILTKGASHAIDQVRLRRL